MKYTTFYTRQDSPTKYTLISSNKLGSIGTIQRDPKQRGKWVMYSVSPWFKLGRVMLLEIVSFIDRLIESEGEYYA